MGVFSVDQNNAGEILQTSLLVWDEGLEQQSGYTDGGKSEEFEIETVCGTFVSNKCEIS